MSSKKKLKIGFIGAGFIAQQCHLPSYEVVEECEIYGITDLYPDLAKRMQEKYKINKLYNSHFELLQDKDIDAVVITLPRKLTSNMCLMALEANKHVITEKPLALNLEIAKNLKKKANLIKKNILVGYMKKNDLGVKAFKKVIRRKIKKQKPIAIQADCFMGNSYCNPFGDYKGYDKAYKVKNLVEDFPLFLKNNNQIGYENYLNVFSHLTDLLNYILPNKIKLSFSNINSNGYGICHFVSDNIPIVVSTGNVKLNQWKENVTFIFDDEILRLSLPPALLKNVPASYSSEKGDKTYIKEEIREDWSWSFLNQASEFTRICSNNIIENSYLDDAIEAIYLVNEIFKNNLAQKI